jgi:tetratricopeptide (TPR) repeat protein
MSNQNEPMDEAQELTDRAFDALHEGDLESAQELTRQLKAMNFSSCFELQALIHLEENERDAAIAELREGVAKAPGAWPLWDLLGNCLSDNGEYESALECYAHGLELDLDDEARGFLQFNRAMVFSRMGRTDEAQRVLDQVPAEALAENRGLRWHVEGLQLCLLADREDCSALIERADLLTSELANLEIEELQENAKEHSIFWAMGGRALLKCGHTEDALEWAQMAVNVDRTNVAAYALLRDASPELPKGARYFSVLLEGEFEAEDNTSFFTSYVVIARVAEEAEQIALEMEAPHWETPPHVVEVEFLGDCELQTIGVCDASPYSVFPRDAEEE